MVKNLDTGEVVSLKVSQEQITQGINPLTLHLMRLTSEFVRYCNLHGMHCLEMKFAIAILVHPWRNLYLLLALLSYLMCLVTWTMIHLQRGEEKGECVCVCVCVCARVCVCVVCMYSKLFCLL